MQVTFAVATQNHIGGGDGKHIGLQFDAVQLVFTDIAFFSFFIGFLQHVVHGGNQKACCAAAGVEYRIGRFDVNQFAKELNNMARGQHDTQRLSVAARIGHKFAVKASQIVFGRVDVFDVFVNVVVDKLSVVFERGFTQYGIGFVDGFGIADNQKLAEQFVFFYLWFDLGTL